MKSAIAVALSFVALTVAHIEHEPEPAHVQAWRRQVGLSARRGLAACAQKMEESGLNARAEARRRAILEQHLHLEEVLEVRDTTSILDKSHHSKKKYKPTTPEKKIFKSKTSCVLSPEGEVGPFYVPGELVRSDVRESQAGVPVVLDAQFINVETCEPVTNAWWDLWNCNSTGVYAGVVENGNGNANDKTNINATFLRGIQKTDSDGVAQFKTMFPGHYTGRTTHHHVVVHLDATELSNGTLTGGTVPHIGQLFYDQSLISLVEATYPYSTNTQALTTNANDRVFADETEDTTSDPVIEYAYLGKTLSKGIFGWITIALNTSATYTPTYSFEYTSHGGVAVSNGGGGVGGPPGSP